MLLRGLLTTLCLLASTLFPARAFLLPILFPISIKITFHSTHKPSPPPPKPDYHFSSVPLYKEVVVKGAVHNSGSGYKHSYGDGHKYGTSYGDGHVKVYTNEPHIKGHKYADGYGSGGHYPTPAYTDDHHSGDQATYIEGSLHISSSPGKHYKGSPHAETYPHYKGTPQVDPHYKGTPHVDPHYKGTPQVDPHYKGTPLVEDHYKGTHYVDPHSQYEPVEGHYDDGPDYRLPHKGHPKKKKVYNKNHSYIKSVAGYKLSDYLPANQNDGDQYHQVSHVAIPPLGEPGHTYADIEAAHKATHGPKAYDAKEYADVGVQHQYKNQHQEQADYLDDTLPAYKYKPTQYFDRKGVPAPDPTEPTTYAGYGTSIYGDSYAKVIYEPKTKNLKISLRTYRQ